MKVLDLFSGIGGFSLGLERAGMETIAFCEIDRDCRAVLKKHWPHVPVFTDIKTLGHIDADLICGGFPCQPFSTASRGRKTAEDLWPEMLRVVSVIKPRFVVAENVLEAPISTAKTDLEKLGYQCEKRCISANDCGADHQRNRWWLVAHPNDEGEFSSALDAEVAKLQELCEGLWGAENYARTVRISNGIPGRMVRLRMLGNAVIPKIPEAIGRAINVALQCPVKEAIGSEGK